MVIGGVRGGPNRAAQLASIGCSGPALALHAAAPTTASRGVQRIVAPVTPTRSRDGGAGSWRRPIKCRGLAALDCLRACSFLRLYRLALPVNVQQEVIKILRSVLSLDAAKQPLDGESALLGSVAELDSMAVVTILTTLEERFGFVVDDDEVDGRTFASVASLTSFVEDKLVQ
jgi:acyl carrier protein